MVSLRFSFTLMGGCPCFRLWFHLSLINLLFWGVVPTLCFWLIIRTFGGLSLSFVCVCIRAFGCRPFFGSRGLCWRYSSPISSFVYFSYLSMM